METLVPKDAFTGNNNEPTVAIMVDSIPFREKPNNNDVKGINARLARIAPQEYTLTKTLSLITNGHTICPGVIKGGRSAGNWVQQELFLVDIDNEKTDIPEMSINNALDICNENNIKPCFIYYSFSSSKEKEKYRIGFKSNRVITNSKEREIIVKTLIKLFPQSDTSCKDACRLFFGTNKTVAYLDKSAVFSFEDILAIQANQVVPDKVEEEKRQGISKNYALDLRTEIEHFDFESWLRSQCGTIATESSNYIMFSECPLCGHRDDFVYFKESKRFKCFGGNGGYSGNIIDYLIITRNLTVGDSIRYFLYDILGHKRPKIAINISKTVLPALKTEKNQNEISIIYNNFNKAKMLPEEYTRDDKGMSKLFGLVVKDFLRYNADIKSWIYYNGKVWVQDVGSNVVNKYMKHFSDALCHYSCNTDLFKEVIEPKDRLAQVNEFQKFIKSLGSKNKRDLIVKDTQSEYPIYNKDLDLNLDLFNCKNGTLNLKTLEFREHRAGDFLSKISNVYYNKNASPEFFRNFINEVFENDTDKINYLQRAMGYTLTAQTNEECFFILFGSSTRNGKTTLTDTILHMIGDYGVQTNPETIAIRAFNDSRTANGDIARLRGARYVNISELPNNMVLNASQIKTLTGGDTITARRLYENEAQFKPQFKIFINTNHLPQVNDDTLFTSDRVNVIKFNRHFKPDEQDKSLKTKLRRDEVISGIFNWCLEGLKEYRKQGLNPPQCILDANHEYMLYNDNIGRFLEECFVHSTKSTKLGTAYDLYCNWCDSYQLAQISKQVFNLKLHKKGITGTVNGIKNMLKNLEIKPDCPF